MNIIAKRLLTTLLACVAVWGLVGCTTPNSGEISVVRNGKAFYWPPDWTDNHKIRQIIQNGSGSTWAGMGSEIHPYPVSTQQRFFRIQTDDDGTISKGADARAVTVPTSDGVETTISGTFYFYTVFGDPASDPGDRLLKSFDTQFGTRTFGGKHVYDGQEGFSEWLTAIVDPVVTNNLRSSISGVRCAELVASCALVQNNGSQAAQQAKALADSKSNQTNVQRIQDEVAVKLKEDLKSTLGEDYFRDIKFQIAGTTLPPKIQSAINDAQSAFAQVSQSQARVQSAKNDADANAERQRGYKDCPACAQIDTLKAIPPNVTTFAPGGNFAVTK